jgi:hypothetical protein
MRAVLRREIKRPKKKLYSEYKKCEMCGSRFEVKHKLRRYCDKCRP